jgi:signal transduction histidine kinase
MMDPGQHRTTDNLREGARNVRGPGRSLGNASRATDIADPPTTARDRARLLSALNELRAADRQLHTENSALGTFLTLLSHEFRSPLQAMFGYTDLLEREIHGPLNDAQHRDLERIQQSQQQLLALIRAMMDFSGVESDD